VLAIASFGCAQEEGTLELVRRSVERLDELEAQLSDDRLDERHGLIATVPLPSQSPGTSAPAGLRVSTSTVNASSPARNQGP
jgi:hypothetical protein